jgi:hypothetical protein
MSGICEHCDCESESLVTVSDQECCSSCVDSFSRCEDCDEKTIETTTVDGNEYCEDCYNSLPYCSHCETTVLETDENSHCESCAEHYSDCARCGCNVFDNGNHPNDVNGDIVCDDCQEYGCIPEDSEYWYNFNDLTWSDHNDCYYLEPPDESIGGYHSSARHQIEGSTSQKYVGFELEVVPLNDRYEVAEDLLKNVSNIVCENDGSIGAGDHDFEEDGFEVISNYGELYQIIDIAKGVVQNLNGKAVSFEAGCCGLHVHLTKDKSVYNNAKFVVFWNDVDNWPFIKQFTHRDNSSWCKRRITKNKESLKLVKNNEYNEFMWSRDKYELIRFTDHTVEIRGYKGTLHEPRLLACIELSYYTYEYCKLDICIDKLNFRDFMEWLPEESRYIRPYFDTRMDKIKLVETKKEEDDPDEYCDDFIDEYETDENDEIIEQEPMIQISDSSSMNEWRNYQSSVSTLPEISFNCTINRDNQEFMTYMRSIMNPF